MLISEDINNFMHTFNELCLKIKNELFEKLDNFYTHYAKSFTNYKNIIDDTFLLSKKF